MEKLSDNRQTINNKGATTRIHRQPLTLTLDNPQSSLDNRHSTTNNYYRQIKPTTNSNTRHPTTDKFDAKIIFVGVGASHNPSSDRSSKSICHQLSWATTADYDSHFQLTIDNRIPTRSCLYYKCKNVSKIKCQVPCESRYPRSPVCTSPVSSCSDCYTRKIKVKGTMSREF
jgi:hypothetical protein